MDTDRLPADRLRLLKEMAEPPHFALENAPEDDEAETPEEVAAVAEAWREHKEGQSLTTDELKRSLGLP